MFHASCCANNPQVLRRSSMRGGVDGSDSQVKTPSCWFGYFFQSFNFLFQFYLRLLRDRLFQGFSSKSKWRNQHLLYCIPLSLACSVLSTTYCCKLFCCLHFIEECLPRQAQWAGCGDGRRPVTNCWPRVWKPCNPRNKPWVWIKSRLQRSIVSDKDIQQKHGSIAIWSDPLRPITLEGLGLYVHFPDMVRGASVQQFDFDMGVQVFFCLFWWNQHPFFGPSEEGLTFLGFWCFHALGPWTTGLNRALSYHESAKFVKDTVY